VNVLDEGRVAISRSYPKRKLMVFLCIILSSMASLLINFIIFKVK